MKLSTRGRYAVTAMLDLALHQEQGPVGLPDIARRQGIPRPYLEQLFRSLRHHKLIESVRGRRGGYVLALEAGAISIARIIYSVDEGMDLTRCGGQQNCQDSERCLTHDLWMGLNQHTAQYLNSINLGQLASQENVRQVARRQDAATRGKGNDTGNASGTNGTNSNTSTSTTSSSTTSGTDTGGRTTIPVVPATL